MKLSVESYSVIARSMLCEWCNLSEDHLVLFSHNSPAYAEEREDSDGQGLCIHHITCEWQRQNWKRCFLAHSLLWSQHFAFLRDISKGLDSKHYHYFFFFAHWMSQQKLFSPVLLPRESWQATIHSVTKSWTWLKQLSTAHVHIGHVRLLTLGVRWQGRKVLGSHLVYSIVEMKVK